MSAARAEACLGATTPVTYFTLNCKLWVCKVGACCTRKVFCSCFQAKRVALAFKAKCVVLAFKQSVLHALSNRLHVATICISLLFLLCAIFSKRFWEVLSKFDIFLVSKSFLAHLRPDFQTCHPQGQSGNFAYRATETRNVNYRANETRNVNYRAKETQMRNRATTKVNQALQGEGVLHWDHCICILITLYLYWLTVNLYLYLFKVNWTLQGEGVLHWEREEVQDCLWKGQFGILSIRYQFWPRTSKCWSMMSRRYSEMRNFEKHRNATRLSTRSAGWSTRRFVLTPLSRDVR